MFPAITANFIAQTDLMAGMVNDLLELSKIHAGTMRLKAEPLDLYDLASDAIADLAALAEQHGSTLDGAANGEPAPSPTAPRWDVPSGTSCSTRSSTADPAPGSPWKSAGQ